MLRSIDGGVTSRPNRTSVRKLAPRLSMMSIQPNAEGGRPADPVVLGFEAALEGDLVMRDEVWLEGKWVNDLRVAVGRIRCFFNQQAAGVECRRAAAKDFVLVEAIVDEIDRREKRLKVVEAEQRRCVEALDAELCARCRSSK